MVFTSLPAGGLLDALCRMRSGGGRNDWPLEPMLKACIARIVYQHPSVESFRRELQRNPSLMLACGFKLMACHKTPSAIGCRPRARFQDSTGNDIPGKGETSDADARWGKHEYHYTDQKGRPLIGISAMVRILSVQVHQELTSISIFCSYICSLSLDDDMHS